MVGRKVDLMEDYSNECIMHLECSELLDSQRDTISLYDNPPSFSTNVYVKVITKATVVASFGYHTIYKIAEAAMMSLASDDHVPSTEEQRYLKQFQVWSCLSR